MASPAKSIFSTSPPSCANQSASAGFVLPSVSKLKTGTADGLTGASSSVATATSVASKPVTAAAPSSRVPGTTTTDSFNCSQSFTAGTSKHSFGASQSFNATTSAMSGAAVSTNNTTASPSPSYSFKPVFSEATPAGDQPKLTQSAPPSGVCQSSYAPTLETMLRSASPVNPPDGSSSQTFVPKAGHGLETLFDASKPSLPSELQTLLNRTTPLAAAQSQTLLNGGTDMFKSPMVSSVPVIAFGAPNKVSAVPTPGLFGFSAPSIGGVKKTSCLSVPTPGVALSTSTYQFEAAPASAAPMFGGGSAPITKNIGASDSMFGQNIGVSASKPGSGVAKSLFGMFGNGATMASSAGGAGFDASKPATDSPRPAVTFGLPPPVNDNPVSATFPPLQNGAATSSAQGAAFQFGAPKETSSAQGAAFQFVASKATSAPSFKPVFNQTPSQTFQAAPFGATSTSFTTPFKGFGQSTFSPKTPVTAGSVFGTPTTPAAAFGGANTFATSSEPKPFGGSSSFGNSQMQPLVGAGRFGATSAGKNFQFGKLLADSNSSAHSPGKVRFHLEQIATE